VNRFIARRCVKQSGRRHLSARWLLRALKGFSTSHLDMVSQCSTRNSFKEASSNGKQGLRQVTSSNRRESSQGLTSKESIDQLLHAVLSSDPQKPRPKTLNNNPEPSAEIMRKAGSMYPKKAIKDIVIIRRLCSSLVAFPPLSQFQSHSSAKWT
jgi:hypothetical protein